MLVLSRKVNEQIVIGNNVRMTVVSIRGNQVRIGFEAPPSISIYRDDLYREHGLASLPGDAIATILHPANSCNPMASSNS